MLPAVHHVVLRDVQRETRARRHFGDAERLRLRARLPPRVHAHPPHAEAGVPEGVGVHVVRALVHQRVGLQHRHEGRGCAGPIRGAGGGREPGEAPGGAQAGHLELLRPDHAHAHVFPEPHGARAVPGRDPGDDRRESAVHVRRRHARHGVRGQVDSSREETADAEAPLEPRAPRRMIMILKGVDVCEHRSRHSSR